MSRKDYVETASILKTYRDEIPELVFEDLVNDFSNFFSSDNKNFDSIRFEEAIFYSK
jgi:hypothetical protein